MKKLILIVSMALLASSAATAQTLEELARAVREAATTEAGINQEREARFVRERDNQRQLLGGSQAGTGQRECAR